MLRRLKRNYFSFIDFKKLHEAQFNKMESIDTYVQRKTKTLETYRGSAKDSKVKLNLHLLGRICWKQIYSESDFSFSSQKPSENTKPQQPKRQEASNKNNEANSFTDNS